MGNLLLVGWLVGWVGFDGCDAGLEFSEGHVTFYGRGNVCLFLPFPMSFEAFGC